MRNLVKCVFVSVRNLVKCVFVCVRNLVERVFVSVRNLVECVFVCVRNLVERVFVCVCNLVERVFPDGMKRVSEICTCVSPGKMSFSRLGEIKLKDFKNLFEDCERYRYYFKALDPEYGTVKEEVCLGTCRACLASGPTSVVPLKSLILVIF